MILLEIVSYGQSSDLRAYLCIFLEVTDYHLTRYRVDVYTFSTYDMYMICVMCQVLALEIYFDIINS